MGRAHRPSGQARDTPIPQGLPCDPQCTRPRCGERPEYPATEQVHLYRAGTNGRPVQQSYTLTGSASIGPPKGKHQGKGPEPTTRTPPPPTTAGKARARHQGNTAPSDAEKRQRGEGTQRGRRGDTPATDPSQGGRGTTQPRPERGHDTQPPHPHRTAKPSPERRGQAPKRTTNTPHTRPRMHTTHTTTTATDTSPTNAQHTPKRKHRPHHKRTQHTKTQRTRTQQHPAGGAAGTQETLLGHKGGPSKPSARSGERPHPATPNQPRPNPGQGTTTPTSALPRTPKPDATTPSPAETPGTNGDTVGNTSDPSTQHNT